MIRQALAKEVLAALKSLLDAFDADTVASRHRLATELLELLSGPGRAAVEDLRERERSLLEAELQAIRDELGGLVRRGARRAVTEAEANDDDDGEDDDLASDKNGERDYGARLASLESVGGGQEARPPRRKKSAKKPPAKAAPKPAKRRGARKTARKKTARAGGRSPRAKKAAAKSRRGARPRRSAARQGSGRQRGTATTTKSRSRQWAPVLLGVSAPRATKAGETFTARFAAYVKELEAGVKEKLKALADVETGLGYSPLGDTRWKLGTHVDVRVSGEHFSAEPAHASFTWSGGENIVHFQVRTKPKAPKGRTQLLFEAFIAGLRVAFIPVDVVIGARASSARNSAEQAPYDSAFASYARRDTLRVTDHLSGFKARVRGTEIFMDCLDLKRGEQWKPQLAQKIDECGVFLLFWSKAAAKSKWVGWEWRRAHARHKDLQAFRLDQPKPALPKVLASLHADDEFQLVRRAYGH